MPTPEKILFVDNDPTVLQGYERLAHGEFRRRRRGGRQGRIGRDNGEPFLRRQVTDQRMGDIDGITLLSRLRKLPPTQYESCWPESWLSRLP